MNNRPVYALEAEDLTKSYENGLIPAVRGVSLRLEKGRIYALTGRSGCGKSTLLNLIGQLDIPRSGHLLYAGKQAKEWGSPARFRREYIGFVFQFHHLIPVWTLRENVAAALLLRSDMSWRIRNEKVEQILTQMGLAHRMDARVTHVSGGERQRAAIARALVCDPRLILADEPTGNVDSETSETIMHFLRQRIVESGATALIATHDPSVSECADVRLYMKDGTIEAVEHVHVPA
jgi:ABC-type lipoprotein export system ATPase subunit